MLLDRLQKRTRILNLTDDVGLSGNETQRVLRPIRSRGGWD
jgi:hypothetical protein